MKYEFLGLVRSVQEREGVLFGDSFYYPSIEDVYAKVRVFYSSGVFIPAGILMISEDEKYVFESINQEYIGEKGYCDIDFYPRTDISNMPKNTVFRFEKTSYIDYLSSKVDALGRKIDVLIGKENKFERHLDF